jgi:hypothetical protein
MSNLKSNNKDLGEGTLQHLASLVSPDAANLIPTRLNNLDLDDNLFHKNMLAASSVIISALVKNIERDRIIQEIRYDHLRAKSFHSYLYEIILEQLRENGEISIAEVTARIPDHSLKYYGEAPNEEMLKAGYYNWALILNMNPTSAQVEKAIELRLIWAQKEGLIPDQDND